MRVCWLAMFCQAPACASTLGVVRNNGVVVLQRHVQDEAFNNAAASSGGGEVGAVWPRRSTGPQYHAFVFKTQCFNNIGGQVWLKFLAVGERGQRRHRVRERCRGAPRQGKRGRFEDPCDDPRKPDSHHFTTSEAGEGHPCFEAGSDYARPSSWRRIAGRVMKEL